MGANEKALKFMNGVVKRRTWGEKLFGGSIGVYPNCSLRGDTLKPPTRLQRRRSTGMNGLEATRTVYTHLS